MAKNILVIKLGALGDFICALGAMKAIREHHSEDHITLLTTKPFIEFAEKSGYFDKIETDQRPKLLQLKKWIGLRQQLNKGYYNRVYDLQNNDRTSIYFRLFSPKPEWVGAAKGASHHYDAPERTAGLPLDGLKLLLENAGIENIIVDPMDWIDTDISKLGLKENYALIVPGAAPSRPEKKWPTEKYIALCQEIADQDIQPVLIGGNAEVDIAKEIKAQCPSALDLTNQTSLFDIITLGRGAKIAIGNDTGPMHMIGPTGTPTIVLFSEFSNPKRNAPMGDQVIALQKEKFIDLNVSDVMDTIKPLLD
ncbi:MAG: glycosyltransferase family 9 protein [Pseudomonadota bacterium]